MNTVIRNGRIIDPANKRDENADLFIADGKLSAKADGSQSVILDQVTNGLAVRMAVLYLCGGIAT